MDTRRGWRLPVAGLALGVLWSTMAAAQAADPATENAPAKQSWWQDLVIAAGVSYRSDSITLVEGSDRALFTTAPGEEFQSYHIVLTQPAGEPSPYYFEFRSFRLTRQKLIRSGEEGDESSTPSGVDLGTAISGFYAMGGREFTAQYREGESVINAVGIGVGAGLVHVEGDVRFAPKLRESELKDARQVESGVLPGVSVDLFAERAYRGSLFGLPAWFDAARIRVGGGVVFFSDARNQLTAEFLQLMLSLHFAL